MTSYPIARWDVITQNNVTMKPIIYIVPDLPLIEFLNTNNYMVTCQISGTNTIYDNRKIIGVVDKSCNIPNCRPNFCEKTGMYIVTLEANWYGYPNRDTLGQVVFMGLKNPVNQRINNNNNNNNIGNNGEGNNTQNTVQTSQKSKVNTRVWIIAVVIGLLATIFLLLSVHGNI